MFNFPRMDPLEKKIKFSYPSLHPHIFLLPFSSFHRFDERIRSSSHLGYFLRILPFPRIGNNRLNMLRIRPGSPFANQRIPQRILRMYIPRFVSKWLSLLLPTNFRLRLCFIFHVFLLFFVFFGGREGSTPPKRSCFC